MSARKFTNKLWEHIESGAISQDTVITCCLKYMSEDDVKDMIECNELFDTDEEEEEIEYTLLDEDYYFEQAEALHVYLTLNHEGQTSNKYALLSRSEFKPGPMWSESKVIEENSWYDDVSLWTEDECETFLDELDKFYENKEG